MVWLIVSLSYTRPFPTTRLQSMKGINKSGKTRYLFKKIGAIKGFHAKMGTIKNRNDKDLIEAEKLKISGENIQISDTRKVLMTQITMMSWSLT